MDYGSGPYEVIFTAGTTEASFNVSFTDDDIFESNENFMITIDPSSLPSNVSVGDPGQVTVTIVDNDGKYCKRGKICWAKLTFSICCFTLRIIVFSTFSLQQSFK